MAGDAARHATLWSADTTTDLGTLGGTDSEARAINDNGMIVGWSLVEGDAAQRATVWNGKIITDLNTFLTAQQVADGWRLGAAYDLTSSGCIVGTASNLYSGESRAFLASPSSDPAPGTGHVLDVTPPPTSVSAGSTPGAEGGAGSTGVLELTALAMLWLLIALSALTKRRGHSR